MNKVRVASIFSGAGGLDIGFRRAGFDIAMSLDKDADCCSTIRQNTAGGIVLHRDITQVSFEKLHSQIGMVAFVIGGPPCQSFSAAGRRAGGIAGINDARGSMYAHYCNLLKIFQPVGFLFENVRGILSSNKGKDWGTIQDAFAELGYTLSFSLLDAADYGVPQHRKRLILVGHKTEAFRFPQPTHGPDSRQGTAYISAGTAIADLDEPNEVVPPYGGKYGHLLPDIPPGQNYAFYTARMGHPQPKFAWRSRFSDFLYKLDPDQPSRTLLARPGHYTGPFHWKNRQLTIPELKRLQGFPDDYRLCGSDRSQVRQIGNSVPPPLSYALAKAVRDQFFAGLSTDTAV